MATPPPAATVTQPDQCDKEAGPSCTSSWPVAELVLETPERNRLRYRGRLDSESRENERPFVLVSPKTPVMVKTGSESPYSKVPGASLFNTAPSPLRFFRFSQSSTPLSDKYTKTSTGIGYRIRGDNAISLTPLKRPFADASPLSQLNYTSSSINDSGLGSMPGYWSTSFEDSGLGNSSDGIFDSYENSLWENPFSSLENVNVCGLDDFPPSEHPSASESTSDYSTSFDKFTAPENFTTAYATTATVAPIAVPTVPATFVMPFEPVRKQNNVAMKRSSVGVINDTADCPVSKKSKPKTVEQEIRNELDKYNDIAFNEEYARSIDMSCFRKLKLMSSLSSNYYKTVLGRSRAQIEVTRDAHKFLKSLKKSKPTSS